MRKVTLYTAESTMYEVHSRQDYIKRYMHFRLPVQEFPDGKFGVGRVERESIPIHHIRECGRDSFIAVEPKLRSMIEMPVRDELAKAKAEAEQQNQWRLQLLERAVSFERLPLWRRLIVAFNGKILESSNG